MLNASLTLHNIQVLRAVAAIMVVLHHAFPHYEAMGGELVWLRSISNWGFVGVDIFFVISGFIMAYTTFKKERGLLSAKTFLQHRLFRVFLGYWPFFFMMLAILLVTHSPRLDDMSMLGSFTLTNVDMFQLVLPVSWSLSYELYFYLLFVFTFMFSLKQLYVAIPLFVGAILFLVLYAFFDASMPSRFFYSHFLLEFFAGVLLFMYQKHLMKLWLLPVSIVIMLISLWYGVGHELKNGLFRVLSFGTAALTLVFSVLILEHHKYFLAGKSLKSLGDASYTLYLSHLIIIELFYLSGLRNLFNSQSTFLPLLGFSLLLAICIIFSLLYYKKIEKPLYQKSIKIGSYP